MEAQKNNLPLPAADFLCNVIRTEIKSRKLIGEKADIYFWRRLLSSKHPAAVAAIKLALSESLFEKLSRV
ncbi:MAG TPA: hypothetical protein VLG12_00120 [Candidatus Saccharimonadales bacterium]|nr:hypothetical protein [Candidatus Saccharimonadales bacterium]